jgi:class 3 adenylate cyclase/predicted ATPase
LEFRILGPLEVIENGRPLDLGGHKQRVVLATLLLDSNRVVSADRLIEALWEDEPPPSAGKALQVHVSQLRRLLGRERVETKAPGYRLRVEAAELDLDRFQELAEAGRHVDALALWRGQPLAEFAHLRFAQADIARLEEARLACLEERIEDDLAQGRHAALVGELEGLVREHPLRERLRSHLMLALYRSGRQAEALDVYQSGRRRLSDELGLEPGEALKQLEREILAHDPSLDLPVVRAAEPRPAAPASPAPGPPAPAREARKTVTVLFCDLAGSTELGERLDPELLRNLMGRWHETMRVEIERHGGTVEKFIGDALMAVFGVPYVHEDDALRAVRAAVEMRAALARLNDDLTREGRPELRMRIGVNSGEVVTGERGATLVTGDAVNTAKRLEEAAAPGEVLVGAATRRLVENAAELEPADAILAKGKTAPVDAWRLLGTIAGATPFARRLDAPLIGRRDELALLRNELAAAERDRTCRLVTVYGAAGIGKSRLAAELTSEVHDRIGVLSTRCLPYGDGITFLPLTDLVRSAGGEDAITAALAGEPDGSLVVERVCGALGSDSSQASAEELFWAIRRLLETLARDAPLLVCIEDVHWAQPTFLDLLEYIAGWSDDVPIVLLCLARPELLEERPRWGGTSLTLEPLTEPESQALLDELAAEWPVSAEERATIASAAEGNPLFVEQLVAMVGEGGHLELGLPPTIQALLAARLDRLEPLERSVLERAAVAGKEFLRTAVTELSPEDERGAVGATLLALTRKEFVRPGRSRVSGDDGFRFRHALIRDAAYGAIPKALRSGLHERFAAWLEQHDGEGELVGYHLEQAHLYRAALAPSDRPAADAELAERAGLLLGAAGARAAARGDAAAALSLLRRSLALLPARHAARIELLRELSAALWVSGDVESAERALLESIEAAQAAGDLRHEWYGRLENAARGVSASRTGTTALVDTAREAIDVFAELGDDLGLARAWRRLALVALDSRYVDAATAAERALTHAAASGDEQERARAADLLCTALLFGPAPVSDAVRRCEEVLESARGNIVLEAHVSTSLAGLVAMQADFERARELYGRAGEIYETLGLRLPRIGWAEVVASVEVLAGETEAAVNALLNDFEVLEQDGYEALRAYHAAVLAFLLAGESETATAQKFLRMCGATASLNAETSARVYAAEALLAAETSEGEQLAHEAVAIAETTDDANLQAAMYATLARITSDSDALAEARRRYEAKGNVVAAGAVGLWSLQP